MSNPISAINSALPNLFSDSVVDSIAGNIETLFEPPEQPANFDDFEFKMITKENFFIA